MKKLLFVLLALFVLVGCSSSKEVIGGDVNNINERGYIVVAMEGTWAPWTYHDETDKLVGYDVEVGKYIADYLGYDVKYVEGYVLNDELLSSFKGYRKYALFS